MQECGGRTEKRVLPILAPLGVHVLLVNFTLLDTWLPDAYFLSHLVVFMVGIWCAHDIKSTIAVICLIVVLAMTIVLDLMALSMYYGYDGNAYRPLSYVMFIINLLLKPFTLGVFSLALFVRAGGTMGSCGVEQKRWRQWRL